jgi:hypothetical protein
MRRLAFTFSVAITLLLLAACGGGGGGGGTTVSVPSYTGLTSEARVEDTNAESLSTAAASGATQAVVADTTGGAFAPRSTPNLEAKLVEISPRIAKWIAGSDALYASKTTDLSGEICDAGGSAIADTNTAETVGTITFRNCGISDGYGDAVYMTGTVDYVITLVAGTADTADTLSMTFHVTVSYAGESESINLTLNCVDLSGSPSCSVRSDFTGVDGRVYRVMDIDVTPYGTDTYYVDATIYDPDHGHFDMTTTAPLVLNCSNGVPSSGTVVIFGSGSTSGTITFVSCSEYNVTIDSVSTTFYWP